MEATDQYWQSNGSSGTHWLLWELTVEASVMSGEIYISSETNYNPHRITIEGGMSRTSMTQIGEGELRNTRGWQPLPIPGAFNAKYIKLRIKACHDGGNDTRISALKFETQSGTYLERLPDASVKTVPIAAALAAVKMQHPAHSLSMFAATDATPTLVDGVVADMTLRTETVKRLSPAEKFGLDIGSTSSGEHIVKSDPATGTASLSKVFADDAIVRVNGLVTKGMSHEDLIAQFIDASEVKMTLARKPGISGAKNVGSGPPTNDGRSFEVVIAGDSARPESVRIGWISREVDAAVSAADFVSASINGRGNGLVVDARELDGPGAGGSGGSGAGAVTVCTFDQSSAVAFSAGDRIGCTLAVKDGFACVHYTLNGAAVGSFNLGKYTRSMHTLDAIVVVGEGNRVAFVRDAPPLELEPVELTKAELALVQLDLAVSTARAICKRAAPPKAITLQDAEAKGAKEVWVWGKCEPSKMIIEESGKVVRKTDGADPDYSCALGSVGFTRGMHTWEMKIDQDTDGVWLGVTTSNAKLNSRIEGQGAPNSWIWRPSGDCFAVMKGTKKQQKRGPSFSCGDKLLIQLNMANGTITFKKNSSSSGAEVELTGVTGEVFPFVCFDYRSKATILSQSTAGAGWMDRAVLAWDNGIFAPDAVHAPTADWGQAHDEQLCKALAKIKVDADPLTAFQDRTPFPQLAGVPIGKLLQRAQLVTRWSSLVVGILPLINLRSTATSPATRAIRQLRSLIMPAHKLKFIEKVLAKVRGMSGSGGMPSFKVSRAKTLGGAKKFAADGSESIAVQIYEELKKAGAAARNDLYSGRELWWKVEFYGEGVQDCGGAFRESVVDIADDLMSDRTPLFIPVSNCETGLGSLRDAFIPNPACTNFELYEWVGRLCAASILSEESLVLRFPPLVWKLLGGAEVAAEDLEEVDQAFLNTMRMIAGAVDGTGDGGESSGGGGGGAAASTAASTASESSLSLGLGEAGEDGAKRQALTADDVEYLCRDFSIYRTDGIEVELVPGGLDVDLTYANRLEYVKLACQARLAEAAPQIAAMRRGLCAVIPAPVVRMWTAQELDLQVCGSPVIPVSTLKDTARFSMDQSRPEVKHLWAALEQLTDEERSLFLRFTTGRARLPASIKISSGDGGSGALPKAATCFNQLYLPPYSSAEQALLKIRYAIHNTRTIDTDGTGRGERFALSESV